MSDGCIEWCILSIHTHLYTFILTWNTPPPSSLRVYLFISPSPPSLLYPFLCLCSFLRCVKFWCLCFWCPAHLYLFVILIYFSLSPWYFSFVIAIFFLSLFFSFKGEMFLQVCRGFCMWSAVFSVFVSFERACKLYLNLTYPLLADHEEYSSELYSCLTSVLVICFVSKQIWSKNHTCLFSYYITAALLLLETSLSIDFLK